MSRISDLMLRRGDIEAQRTMDSGQMWGGIARAVGSIPMSINQMRAQQAQAGQQAENAALQRKNVESQIAAREGETVRADAEAFDKEEGRRLAAKTTRVNDWLSMVASNADAGAQREAYAGGRAALIADGTLTEADAPTSFPGASWVKSRMALLLPAQERFKALFPDAPDGFTLTEGQTRFGADGKPLANVPKPPPAPESFTLSPGQSRYGADGKVVAQGPPQREPQGPAPDYEWVTRNGQPTQIRKGTAQAGDTPYDAVSQRQAKTLTPEEVADAKGSTERALKLADRLLDPKDMGANIGAATGAYELRGFTQGAQDFNGVRNQLIAALALPNLGALRGPMSDKDVIFVKQLATRLENPKLSEKETKLAIREAQNYLRGKLDMERLPDDPDAVPAPTQRVNPFRK